MNAASQDSIELLLNYFNGLISLSKEEKELVTEKFRYRLYRKRQYALQEGDVCGYFNFIVRGCMRMYKVDDLGGTHSAIFG